MTLQEIVALTLSAVAAAYLVKKLTGWPPSRPLRKPEAVVSDRLSRGLREAERQRDRRE